MTLVGGWRAALALSVRVYWLPGLVFAVHVLLLSGPDYYKVWESSDELMHLAGGFAIAFAAARALFELRRLGAIPELGPLLRFVLLFALVGCATVLWELTEFLSDTYLGTETLGDLEDTLADQALGLAGGLAFLLGGALLMRRLRG